MGEDDYDLNDLLLDTKSWNNRPAPEEATPALGRMTDVDVKMQTHPTVEEPATGDNPLPPPTAAELAQQEADDMAWYEQAGRGVLGGLEVIGQQVGGPLHRVAKAAGLSDTPMLDRAFNEQTLQESAKRRAPVENTPMGFGARLGTDVVGTLGLGGVLGPAKGILPAMLRGGAEGGAAAYMTGGSPGMGAGIGMAPPAIVHALRRGVSGIIPANEAAARADYFTPIAGGADKTTQAGALAAKMYGDWFPNMPGGNALLNQGEEAVGAMRMRSLNKDVTPKWAFDEGHIKHTDNEADLWKQIKSFYRTEDDSPAWSMVNPRMYNGQELSDDVKDYLIKTGKAKADENGDIGDVRGSTLMWAKKQIDNDIETSFANSDGRAHALKGTKANLQDDIRFGLSDAARAKFDDVSSRYGYMKDIELARYNASVRDNQVQNQYTPGEWYDAAKTRAGISRGSQSAPGTGGPSKFDAQTAIGALSPEPIKSNWWKTLAAWGAMGAGGAAAGPLGFAALPLGVRGLSSQPAQTFLMGKNQWQRKLSDYLRQIDPAINRGESASSVGAGTLVPKENQ